MNEAQDLIDESEDKEIKTVKTEPQEKIGTISGFPDLGFPEFNLETPTLTFDLEMNNLE